MSESPFNRSVEGRSPSSSLLSSNLTTSLRPTPPPTRSLSDMTVPLPPAHPTESQIASAPRRHRLFGFPISHSASPAFHNLILQALPSSQSSSNPPTYSLCDTKSISEPHFKSMVRDDPSFGGASVTMPLKVEVAKKLGPTEILDELSDSSTATQTVNTIVVLPPNSKSEGKKRMLGTNTDYLGIRHAVLRSCALQNSLEPSSYLDGDYSYPKSPVNNKPYSAFIIGSGGTCRSAVYAMSKLGFSPLYLLNRDRGETQDVIDHFKSTGSGIDLRSLRSQEEFDIEAEKRKNGELGPIAAAVGAIPAFEPQSEDEKMVSNLRILSFATFTVFCSLVSHTDMHSTSSSPFQQVYQLAHAFFDEPYHALSEWNSSQTPSLASNEIPLPANRPFLDMCYKPRLTPLLAYASQAGQWASIGGVEAMIEQGLAQARMFAASAQILKQLETNPDQEVVEDPASYSTRAGDQGPLGSQIERNAREMVLAMNDIIVPSTTSSSSTTIPTPTINTTTGLGSNVSKSGGSQLNRNQARSQPVLV